MDREASEAVSSRAPVAPPSPSAPFLHPGFGSGASLLLVRHGEVREDYQGRAYGNLDVPLSEEGERDSAALAALLAELGPDRVLTSPLQRARHLGERTASLAGVELEVCDALEEVHRGTWQGERVADLSADRPDEVARFYADPWTFREHGGESDEDIARRAFGALADLFGRSGDAPSLAVLTTHYNVIRVLVAGALGVPAPASFALRVDPARAVLLVDRPDGWHLVDSNTDRPRRDPGLAH